MDRLSDPVALRLYGSNIVQNSSSNKDVSNVWNPLGFLASNTAQINYHPSQSRFHLLNAHMDKQRSIQLATFAFGATDTRNLCGETTVLTSYPDWQASPDITSPLSRIGLSDQDWSRDIHSLLANDAFPTKMTSLRIRKERSRASHSCRSPSSYQSQQRSEAFLPNIPTEIASTMWELLL